MFFPSTNKLEALWIIIPGTNSPTHYCVLSVFYEQTIQTELPKNQKVLKLKLEL